MKSVMELFVCLLIVLPAIAAPARAQDAKLAAYPAMAPVEQYRMASRQDEIALARTAAPASISAEAEVLVLGSQGYETAVKGKNGFVCFVERSWTAGFDDRQFWNPKLRAPNCFNPQAVRSVLPQYLERTTWVLAGDTKPQMIEKAKAAFTRHHFVTPEAGSISFMLSKQGYISDEAEGPWLPHMMFFIPSGEAAAWAAGLNGSPVLGTNGTPFEPTVLFMPVRQWSDGSPAPSPEAHSH